MKIYTKTGDHGETSLFGGRRTSKDDLRIEAYGTVDELNAQLGLLAASVDLPEVKNRIIRIQTYLFVIGSKLASDPFNPTLKTPELNEDEIQFLEEEIDQMEKTLVPLRYFILPGSDVPSSTAHICRTVCRRAERRVVSLNQLEQIDHHILIYLNRLSDYLFVLSRYIARINGMEEIYWKT
ncbi:MAG TPA: cob(I)yrinic acid a,c-diamide adenosyltransferase [Saprospiraceae bacterium]|nr:cob(I)yrinic acid a,c-diamide adenosyltransferase [Saprospiraceae bacterium]